MFENRSRERPVPYAVPAPNGTGNGTRVLERNGERNGSDTEQVPFRSFTVFTPIFGQLYVTLVKISHLFRKKGRKNSKFISRASTCKTLLAGIRPQTSRSAKCFSPKTAFFVKNFCPSTERERDPFLKTER